MTDHDYVVVRRNFTQLRVLCHCGWVSGWGASREAVEAEHELHVELASATPDDFSTDDRRRGA